MVFIGINLPSQSDVPQLSHPIEYILRFRKCHSLLSERLALTGCWLKLKKEEPPGSRKILRGGIIESNSFS